MTAGNRPFGEGRRRELALRSASGLVLAAVAGAALALGHPFMMAFVMLAAGIMAREWSRLCGTKRQRLAAILLGSGVMLAAAGTSLYDGAIGLILTGATAVLVAASLLAARQPAGRTAWTAGGALYIGVPVTAFLWIFGLPDEGPLALLWIVAVVAATDIGAYFVGRTLGGRRLAPRISPGKTWSGLIGGVAAAALAGGLIAALWGGRPFPYAAAGAAALGIVAQLGDLFESGVKRNFHVKDAGGLLPGHGGLLDRVDGLLAAVTVSALAVLANHGKVPAWT